MFFSIRFVELKTAVICYRSEFEMDKFSMSWRRWKLGYRLSAVALSGEKTNFGWTPPILAGQHSLSRGELGKKCDCFTGGNRTWSCIFRANLWCFTTKLETQWRARRKKIILYKVRLKESCDPWYESVPQKPKVSYNEFRISVAPLSSLEYSYCIRRIALEAIHPCISHTHEPAAQGHLDPPTDP